VSAGLRLTSAVLPQLKIGARQTGAASVAYYLKFGAISEVNFKKFLLEISRLYI
jgi:hypothetical protein